MENKEENVNVTKEDTCTNKKCKDKKHDNKTCIKKEELEMINNKLKDAEEKALRSQAELINYRKRKDEETARILKFANEDLVMELLPVIDNFERALIASKDAEPKVLEGITMIYNSFVNALNKYGVKEIEAMGKIFDENYHNAVMTDSVPDKKENEIIDVLQKGYMLKDKVIRPAMVKVNK